MMSNLAASSPILEPLIGAKSMVTESRAFGSLSVLIDEVRSFPASPLT